MSENKLTSGWSKPLPLPPHYDPAKVEHVWRVPYQQRAETALAWAKKYGLPPASQDGFRVALIVVDMQNTFCLPEFELFVGGRSGKGAVEDGRRLCEFIYRNLGVLTQITLTMDTHRVMQIFHPIFLVDEQGHHPDPLTLVSLTDVESGRWRLNTEAAINLGIEPAYAQEHLLHYTRGLKDIQKYDLTIWPYHAMLGGIGHALVSSVEEAVFFHTIARLSQPDIGIKGELALTESYSAIGPEILRDPQGKQIGTKSDKFINKLIKNDMVLIAGEAKSHCVAWTIDDLLAQIRERDPELARKVYLLEDCTSPVVVPGVVDYSDQADTAFQRFAEAGMHIVRSTETIEDWLRI